MASTAASALPWRDELQRLLALGGPVAATQLGAMLLGVVDAMMVGHVGVLELDAATLGNIWLLGTMIFGMGVVFGMDPLVSQAHGAGDGDRVAATLQRGVVVAVTLSIPLGASWLLTGPVLRMFGQDPALAAAAHDYVVLQIPSLAPFLVFQALRGYLQGRGLVAPALWIMVIANLFNALANWVLIYGHAGFPALGLTGAATATALTRTLLLVAMVLWIRGFRLHVGAWRPWSRAALQPAGLVELLRLGVPVGVQYTLEVWAFQAATLFAGLLGEVQLAAHVIALNLASVSFMLPLGLSQGAATRIGNLLGAGQPVAAQRSAYIALAMGGGVMAGAAVVFVALADVLPRAYNADPVVIGLAATILPVAAAFQLFDGVQVVGGGILRGMGSTRPAAVFNVVGFYVLALPFAAWLTFERGFGLQGIWWGLAVGLAAVAALLVLWIHWRGPAKVSAWRRADKPGVLTGG